MGAGTVTGKVYRLARPPFAQLRHEAVRIGTKVAQVPERKGIGAYPHDLWISLCMKLVERVVMRCSVARSLLWTKKCQAWNSN